MLASYPGLGTRLEAHVKRVYQHRKGPGIFELYQCSLDTSEEVCVAKQLTSKLEIPSVYILTIEGS